MADETDEDHEVEVNDGSVGTVGLISKPKMSGIILALRATVQAIL